MSVVHHALVLNLHQPLGNLQHLFETQPWEAREILYAYDRIPRFLWAYEDVARVHLSVSGSLLKTLSSPEFQQLAYGIVDCGSLLWHLQNRAIIDILGTAFYYPILPLIPEADRADHLTRWQASASHLFWRENFPGFWPPEMAFSMELIPLLKQMGYRYVLVDSEHVRPLTAMTEAERLYRPHLARFGGEEIVVVVRDRSLSDAMASGMDWLWFVQEIAQRTASCDFEPLVTTCCDGENGAWFRNMANEANFWGGFYGHLLESAREDGTIRPCFIGEYLDRHEPFGEVTVETGAWNTEWHDGTDFSQWTGLAAQQRTLERIGRVSAEVHAALREAGDRELGDQERCALDEAHTRLLRAETSCNFYWGEDWVARSNQDLDEAESTVNRFRAKKYLIDGDPGWLNAG
jgi:alpha-amylase/alpha-mannosidase (GH57 family)